MVFSPHPDDETLGCGGSIALCAEKGAEVAVITITTGDRLISDHENLVATRRAEAHAAAERLGVKTVTFLDFADGTVSEHRDDIRTLLRSMIVTFRPDLVFAPSPLDPHPDHQATGEIAMHLLADVPRFKLAYYGIYQPLRFNHLIDITLCMEKKKAAVQAYKVSLLGIPDVFWHAAQGLSTYWSFFSQQQGFYEAFWVIDRPLTTQDILSWCTYDYQPGGPEEQFLAPLRIADALIHDVRLANAETATLRALVDSLREDLAEHDKALREFTIFRSSLFYRAAQRFYRARDALLPDDSLRRRLYDRTMNHLKKP
jgi:LmbE family N-acetylglucosaminyl deacetylase